MTQANGLELSALNKFLDLLLSLTALSGELPTVQISRLPTAYTYKKCTVKKLQSEVSRRLRFHRMAEVLVTMFNADISVLLWERPSLSELVPPDDIPFLK